MTAKLHRAKDPSAWKLHHEKSRHRVADIWVRTATHTHLPDSRGDFRWCVRWRRHFRGPRGAGRALPARARTGPAAHERVAGVAADWRTIGRTGPSAVLHRDGRLLPAAFRPTCPSLQPHLPRRRQRYCDGVVFAVSPCRGRSQLRLTDWCATPERRRPSRSACGDGRLCCRCARPAPRRASGCRAGSRGGGVRALLAAGSALLSSLSSPVVGVFSSASPGQAPRTTAPRARARQQTMRGACGRATAEQSRPITASRSRWLRDPGVCAPIVSRS